MNDKGDSPQNKKTSKARERTPNEKHQTRTSRSNSNATLNGSTSHPAPVAYSAATNSEEMQPLLRKVQTVRLARLSLVMNCTLFISILVLVAALTILGISISTFTYTIIFPYHNYFVVEFNADDSFPIEPGVAVSSIGGRVRTGSGFNFVYQRVTDSKLPSFPLQVQTFSFFPSNPKLVLVYNANGDGRLYSTIVDDEAITANSSSFTTTNPPYLFDTEPVTSSRFVTLYADQIMTRPNYYTTKLYVVQGESPDVKTVFFNSPYFILEDEQFVPQENPPQLHAYLGVLANDRYSIIMHQKTKEGTGCVNHLLQYFSNNDTWKTLDSQYLIAPCRTGNVSPMTGTRAVLATETDIRIVDYSGDRIFVISPVTKFTCRPSYLIRNDPTADSVSQIDVKATSSHGFLLSCTWYRSAAALYGVVRAGTNQINLGDFVEFDNAIPGTVQLSGALETTSDSQDNKHSVYATYRSQATGKYQTIRCGVMETYKGFFVTYSKPYVHMTYSPEDIIVHNDTKFISSVDVMGVSKYGIMFVSSAKQQGNINGVFEIELAKWNGGIKWVGISVTDSNQNAGKAKVVQKGITWGHQGLIPGSAYYADVNGQLTLSKTDTYVGMARSPTEIMIDDFFVR